MKSRFNRRTLCAAIQAIFAVAVGALALPAGAQTAEPAAGETITVSGSRLPASLRTMPQSVQVIDSEDIERQALVAPLVSDILANLVPGISRGTNTSVNTYTSVRGRKPVVLIDGAPITSTLNDTARELNLIDPDSIRRIEVIPGSSALYGNSAGAGFINYVTKGGDRGTLNMRTEVGAEIAGEHARGDGISPSVRQTFSGTTGAFDYRVSGLYRDIRDFYDADGNVIPPQLGSGIQDSKVKAFSTKLGYNFGRQRIEGSFSYYDQPAEIKWAVRNGNITTGVPASAIPAVPQPGQVEEENKAKVGNLVFSDPSIFGTSTSFRAQGYYVDTLSWFQYALNRFPLFPEAPSGQSGNMTKKTGARFDLNTPMKAVSPLDGSILWGLDFMRDDTKIPLVDGRQFGIPQVLNSVAAFVQLQLNLTQRLKLSAGIRHEDSKLDVSDYLSVFTRARITGGRLDFKTNPGNAGLVFSITSWLDVYGGWSQGFDIQQTSQNFRAWPVDINLAKTKPPANVIDSYEAGLRFNGAGFKGSIGVYQVESSNGISYVFNAATPNEPRAVVAPDRIRGIEAIVDYNGLERWNLGATFARNFGYADSDNNGTFETPLQNRRIPPPSATAHAEYELTPTSFVRAQLLWSGDRNAFPNTVPGRFHEGHVHSFTTVDVSSRFILAKNMELALGVRNLFNRDYYTNYSEGFNTNDNYMKAPGRTFTVRFAVNY